MRVGQVPGAQTQRADAGVGAAVGAADRAALRTHAEPGALGRRPRGPARAHQPGPAARAGRAPAARALVAHTVRAAAALVARHDPGRGTPRGRRAALGQARAAVGAPHACAAEPEAGDQPGQQQQQQQREERRRARHDLLQNGRGASAPHSPPRVRRRHRARPVAADWPGLHRGVPAGCCPGPSRSPRTMSPDQLAHDSLGSSGHRSSVRGNLPEIVKRSQDWMSRSSNPRLAPILPLNPPRKMHDFILHCVQCFIFKS